MQESVQSHEDGSKCSIQPGPACDGLQNAVEGSSGMPSSRSFDESHRETVTDLWRCSFSDIFMSEKFAELCSLLLAYGIKPDKFLDLSHINSRMKQKAYESSPLLLHSDIQQIWKKVQKLGDDIMALAKCLSDNTTTSFREQVGSSAQSISEDARHEFHAQESDKHKAEDDMQEVHTCRHCGEETDLSNGLRCHSCEEMYHISCIGPAAVKEIPVRTWYCENCSAEGIERPHDNCIACERLNTSRSAFYGNGEDELVYEEAPDEMAESSNELVANECNKRFPLCKVCRTEVRNDEDYRICGHSFCLDKFYHVRCLTSKQLISHGPCWYCPSCLCRACFKDQHDDKIVLCDGCDHAYHIYCMKPPLTAIPRGKWFCTECSTAIQRIHKARLSYENMLHESKKRSVNGTLKTGEAFNKSGGVDMLLNAAKTLNYEEESIGHGITS